MLNKIRLITSETKSSSFFSALKKYSEYILSETSFLNNYNPTFNERVYCIVNNIKEVKLCLSCNTKVKFTNYTKGYKIYCSLSCSRSSKETLKKRQDTMIEKYGTTAPNREKMKETNIERYGSEYASSANIIKNKVKETVKERYGVNNVSKVKSVRNKVEKTMLEKYGEKCNLSLKEEQKRIKKTNIKKYGTEYPIQSEIIKDTIKKNNLKKYGTEYFSQSKEYKRKRYLSFISHLDKILKEFDLKRAFKKEDYVGGYIKINGKRFDTIKYKIKCLKCEGVFKRPLSDGNIPTDCDLCGKQKKGISKGEDTLNSFLEELGLFYERSNRKILNGLELDFYFEKYKLAIEYNGLYYHSYRFLNKSESINYDRYINNKLYPDKGKNFHLLKTKLSEERGIKLLHINEDEWLNKREILKSMIRYNLNLIDYKINARKCKVVEVSTKDAKIFLEDNHLQGSTNSSIRLGLIYDDRLVSLMTFSKNRYSVEDYELVRFVNEINTNIRGSASKLFNHFIKNFQGSIITFADRRYSQGDLYTFLGFKELYILEPQYKYIKNQKTYHRMFFQKKNIKKLYLNYKNNKVSSSGFGLIKQFYPELTGEENLIINNINKIYDSGHIKYVYKNKI